VSKSRTPSMLGDRHSSHPSAGLDQLGPRHYAGEGHRMDYGKKRKASISARAGSSTTRRHVKVSLAKVPFTDRKDT
jgi:hypothetical protein